jgi:hypothetical protein
MRNAVKDVLGPGFIGSQFNVPVIVIGVPARVRWTFHVPTR